MSRARIGAVDARRRSSCEICRDSASGTGREPFGMQHTSSSRCRTAASEMTVGRATHIRRVESRRAIDVRDIIVDPGFTG